MLWISAKGLEGVDGFIRRPVLGATSTVISILTRPMLDTTTLLQVDMEVEKGPLEDYYPVYRALHVKFGGGYMGSDFWKLPCTMYFLPYTLDHMPYAL